MFPTDQQTPPKQVNILLVEDDEVDVMNFKRALRKSGLGHPIYEANNGSEALKMLKGDADHPPQVPKHRLLILLDLDMPRMNGTEFLRVLREDPDLKTLPVVVLTTSDADQDLAEAFQLNVAGYIVKSRPFREFVDIISALSRYWALSEMP
jgi:CheY-like chemotaxis protein